MPTKQSRQRRKFSWRTFALGIAIVAALWLIEDRHPAVLELADLKAGDLRINSRPPMPPTGKVVIGAIDDKSIAEMGQWQWPRSTMARVVDALRDYKVAVIGFDILFTEHDSGDIQRAAIAERLRAAGLPEQSISRSLDAGSDETLAASMKAQGATVLAYPFESHMFRKAVERSAGFVSELQAPHPMEYNLVRHPKGDPPDLITAVAYLPPIEILNRAAKNAGFVDVDADLDGTIRTELTVIKFQDRYSVPFFLSVLSVFAGGPMLELGMEPEGVTGVSIGDHQIPVDELGRMIVRFRGPARSFPHVSLADVVAHRVAPEKLAGTIVLIGVTGAGLGDRGVTPAGAEFPRVEIHANAIDNVIRGDFIRHPMIETAAIERDGAIVLGVAVAGGAALLPALWSAAAAIALAAGYFWFAQHLLFSDGLLIGVVFPLLTIAVTYTVLASYRYLTEGLEKRYLRHAFEHYLHPDVIASVVDNPAGLKLGGERRYLSILFADIVNYTGLSERTDPAALVSLLNDYMTRMTDHILEGGGVVDKIRGDGIMAFWGAPLEVPNHARAATDAALAMLTELAKLKSHDPRFEEIDIGIGIATGEAIVGNFGGEHRFDYSVIGDTVNLASRLEGLTRHFKVRLLVSRQTFIEAKGDYVAREIGLVKVKGKEQRVAIVEVAGHRNDRLDPAFYRHFAGVLELIRTGSAATAREKLKEMGEQRPNDHVVRLYLEKLSTSSAEPPTEMVFEFESK
ncbi:MAG TPA: adenylate/guanylate cyclase domain-containing protein [Candidatus Binataceae bacterium]